MTANPEPRPERRLPVPLQPDTPGAETGKLKALLRYRFFLVSLVILIFLGGLFFWGTFQQLQSPVPPETAPGETPPSPPKITGHGPPALPGPAPEAPAKAPPPLAPAPAPRVEPAKGEIFTRALIRIMDDQLNQSLFGWRPNSIIFGKFGLTDNVNNMQMGVLDVVRRTVVVLNDHMTRFAITEAYNPNVNEAMNFFMVSHDKYWFPSASGKYQEAIRDLEKYIDSLHKGRSRFYPRVDNLIALVTSYKDILGSSYHNLIKDAEADGSPVTWWVVDDYFYFARGLALGMSQMLEAVKEEFQQELQKKGSHKLLDDAIHALHTAAHLSPWVVTNGGKGGILANHRANMSTYIGEAEHVVATLQTVLATN